MKNRFTITASCAAILSLCLAAPAMAQSSERNAGHDALIQDMMEEDGAYLEGIEGYGNQGQIHQSPYNHIQDNGSDPCSIYQNHQTPACQNRQPAQDSYYGQKPYSQNPYEPSYNPNVQLQRGNTGYTPEHRAINPHLENNPFGPPSSSMAGTQSVQIMDRQNPQGRPMVATIRQIPAGWRASGGINWRQSNKRYCGLMTPHITWSAQSPDGRERIELLPEEMFAGIASRSAQSALRGCPNTDIRDGRAFAAAYIQAKRPGARISNITPPTQAEHAMLQGVVPPLPPTGDPSTRQRADANAAKIRLSYTENGQSFDEVAFVTWVSIHTTSDPIMGFGGAQGHNTILMPTFTMRAPSGQLDEARAEALYTMSRPNPAHQQMTSQYHNQQARQTAKQFITESKARMIANRRPSGGSVGSSNPVGDIIAAGGPESGRNPNGQSNTIGAIRGVTEYNDPNSLTGTVEGNIGQGDSMFRRDDGSYVQTSDPFYNQGTKLEPRE